MPEYKSFHYIETASVNDEAVSFIRTQAGSHTCLFLADSQSGGRGRQGKSFFSPVGGLYMCLLFPYRQGGELALSAAAAVAVCEQLSQYDERLGIKWVNDIYLPEGKLCGILCEQCFSADGIPHMAVGIGINIKPQALPADFPPIAFLNAEVDRAVLAESIADRLLQYAEQGTDSVYESYRRLSLVLGKRISYLENGEWFSALAVDIAPDGSLQILDEQGLSYLSSGEISLRLTK